jgi:peptide/nickel transport system substrate-binding protein
MEVKRNIVLLAVTSLMVAALALAACGGETTTPPVTTPPTTTPPTTTPPTTTPPTTTPTAAEKPQYGGTHLAVLSTDIPYFDDTVASNVYCYSLHYTNDELLTGDWAKGPAGTGEVEWEIGGTNRLDQKAGAIAESWEIPQQGTIIFHIRQGVHWALNPKSEASRLVNGRELTVSDVVYSINRAFTTPGAYFRVGYPNLCQTAVVTAGPENTVTVTCPVSEWVNLIILPDYLAIVPPEVIAKYGNMQDWRNSVGTGPFMLTDFVSNSLATYVKNPNYWEKNPIGPGKGDQLPYLDGIKVAIIPDSSTRVAAFRTGKIYILSGTQETRLVVGSLLDDPTLKIIWKRYMMDSSFCLGMRTDLAESPFSKKDVRQAIMYALDLKAVKDKYYLGDAELQVWPICPPPAEYKDVYVPLEELPANVQALYAGPDVTKAKELLKKAGYPNGFNVTAIGTVAFTVCPDILSMFQSDLAKVGINMTIDLKDLAVYGARLGARNYGAYDILMGGMSGIGSYQRMINFRGTSQNNLSYVNDPVVEAAYQEMQKYIGIDEAKCMQIHRNLMPYLLEQAYVIPVPGPYYYVLWWPWVKNYHGELTVGYYNSTDIGKYIWLDQALKKEMTGK